MTEDFLSWYAMPTQVLLDQAYALVDQQPESEASRCILALAWRLRGSEEWIESLNRRAQSALESRKPS